MTNIKMQTCWELIADSTIYPYTANVSMGSILFNLHEEDFKHIFENQTLIRDIISPKYQLMFLDLGMNMKSVAVTLTKELL